VCSSVTIDPSKSALPAEAWSEEVVATVEDHLRLPGNLQLVIGPYLHVFLTEGFTQKVVDQLIEDFPTRETDIRIAAFMFAASRENVRKDSEVLNVRRATS
jgi:hypothetical protein